MPKYQATDAITQEKLLSYPLVWRNEAWPCFWPRFGWISLQNKWHIKVAHHAVFGIVVLCPQLHIFKCEQRKKLSKRTTRLDQHDRFSKQLSSAEMRSACETSSDVEANQFRQAIAPYLLRLHGTLKGCNQRVEQPKLVRPKQHVRRRGLIHLRSKAVCRLRESLSFRALVGLFSLRLLLRRLGRRWLLLRSFCLRGSLRRHRGRGSTSLCIWWRRAIHVLIIFALVLVLAILPIE